MGSDDEQEFCNRKSINTQTSFGTNVNDSVEIKEKHKCEEGNVYNNCNEYKGSDKKICENILSPKRNSYCVLDKDSVCKEREFYCPEAHDRYECLIYAKPTDNNKKCVWDVDDKNFFFESNKNEIKEIENIIANGAKDDYDKLLKKKYIMEKSVFMILINVHQ